MMDKTAVNILKCSRCGGAMVPDQKSHSYFCPFCRNTSEFSDDNFYKQPPIKYRHREKEIKGKAFSVLHTVPLTKAHHENVGWLRKSNRLLDIDSKLEKINYNNSGETGYATAEEVTFLCPNCNGIVTGEVSQNFFDCPHCRNKIAKESINHESYNIRHILGRVGIKNIPGKALPFAISKQEASSSLINFIHNNSLPFDISALDSYISEAIQANYLPFSLIDTCIQANVSKFPFYKETYYQEFINWSCPECVLFDPFVTDRLAPWDFSVEQSFDPKMVDGDIRIASISNLLDRSDLMDSLLYSRMVQDIYKKDAKKVTIDLWGRDYHPHHQYILLPIYWIDVKGFDGKYFTAAVNGQTGKPVIQVLYADKKEDMLIEGKPIYWNNFSSDSSMVNMPAKIKLVKGSMKWAESKE